MSKIIGIDLGTTNSAVAIIEGDLSQSYRLNFGTGKYNTCFIPVFYGIFKCCGAVFNIYVSVGQFLLG
jgi:hypothetical protein